MEIIASLIIIYFMIATIVLINLLYNPNVNLEIVNIETGEKKEVPPIIIIEFALFWIITIPLFFKKAE